MNCPYCDVALTRVAVLAKRLQSLGTLLHARADHQGNWIDCREEPCYSAAMDYKYGGLDKTRHNERYLD